VLADAINRAKSIEGEKIGEALAATDMPGEQTIMPWKRVKFDEMGQNNDADPVLLQYIGGKFVTNLPAAGRGRRSHLADEVMSGAVTAVGWAKPPGRAERAPDDRLRVPTIQDRDRIGGGHGAKGAFAHPTICLDALRMTTLQTGQTR